ncbi:hypothetical protein HDK90DRAFT_189888 [Phyllosticta capitalensis]|uniref:Uncharacterized protein n=1 Tax=Phyllosticta capitalensis TaxID=121624 RepID=A0ABR1YWQ4_9PEZI
MKQNSCRSKLGSTFVKARLKEDRHAIASPFPIRTGKTAMSAKSISLHRTSWTSLAPPPPPCHVARPERESGAVLGRALGVDTPVLRLLESFACFSLPLLALLLLMLLVHAGRWLCLAYSLHQPCLAAVVMSDRRPGSGLDFCETSFADRRASAPYTTTDGRSCVTEQEHAGRHGGASMEWPPAPVDATDKGRKRLGPT